MASSSPTPSPPSPSFSPPIAVLQCSSCLVILSDTLRYFVSSHAASQTITVSAAHNISVAPGRLRAKSGLDADCCFQLTSCANCCAPLGRFYTDASPGQENLLNNYSFASASLISYQLGCIDGAPSPASAPAPTSAPASSAAAPKSTAPEISGGPACDVLGGGGAGGGSGGGGGGKDLALALAELDAHVAKLTSAANASTQAQGRMGEVVRVVREEAARVEAKLSVNETALDKMQNLFIRWEDRFTDLERRAGLVDDRLAERDESSKRFASKEDGGVTGRNADEDDNEDGILLNVGRESPRGRAGRGEVDFRGASDGREDDRNGRRGGRDGRDDGRDGQKGRRYFVNRGNDDGMHGVVGGRRRDGANWIGSPVHTAGDRGVSISRRDAEMEPIGGSHTGGAGNISNGVGNYRKAGEKLTNGGSGFLNDGERAPYLRSSSDFVSPQPRHVDILPGSGGLSSSRGRNDSAHEANKRPRSNFH